MRLERNKDLHSHQQPVRETIAATIEEFRVRCDVQGVSIETDLGDCAAIDDTAFVKATTEGLISNALFAMPAGGEVSLTLVESAHQWELEVADTGTNPSRLGKPNDRNGTQEVTAVLDADESQSLPTIIEFPTSEALREVIRLATKNRASVESFACPLGGTAWVVVVSKYRSGSKIGKRAA